MTPTDELKPTLKPWSACDHAASVKENSELTAFKAKVNVEYGLVIHKLQQLIDECKQHQREIFGGEEVKHTSEDLEMEPSGHVNQL